jgi:transposase
MLFCEPDFAAVKSILEEICENQGFSVLFLPKFRCELNPIEQAWGLSKQKYRLNPPSSKEAILESNMLKALDEVPIIVIRR